MPRSEVKKGFFYILDKEANQTGAPLEAQIDLSTEALKQPSNKVSLLAHSDKEVLIREYFHCLNNQITPVIINPAIPQAKQDELRIRLENKTRPNFMSHITCSSGTTSSDRPIKAFLFRLERPVKNGLAHYESLGISGAQNILFPMPLTHSFGVVIGMLSTVTMGHHLYTFNETPKNPQLISAIEEREIDLLYLTPTLARLLMKFMKRKKLTVERSMKISIGAAHIYKSEILELMNYFPNAEIFYTYGLSELGPRVSTLNCEKKGSTRLDLLTSETLPIGAPLAGVEMEIENGTLHVRSDYANEDIEDLDQCYFNTQDMAEETNLGQDTLILLKGRADFTINFAGVNIYPQEIEPIMTSLVGHRNILLGLPSKLHGEIPVLVIEGDSSLEASFDQKKFIEDLSKQIIQDFLPQRIYFLETFPTTNMGKIKRQEILQKITSSN